MNEVLRAQLYAVRAQIDAILIGLGEPTSERAIVVGSCPHCGGPEAKQVDASTLSAPNRKHCLLCEQEYDG